MVRSFLVISAIALIVACAGLKKKAEPDTQWFNSMHRLSAAHLRVMPLAANGRAFSDPARKPEIDKDLKELSAAASSIAAEGKAPDADPLIAFSAQRFALEVKQAARAFEMGDTQWSRYALNRASGYCISCHTRADRGARDFPMAWAPDLNPLRPEQRVEFLLANRRYSSALTEAKILASDIRVPQGEPLRWMVAIERAMAMVVRVKKDPVEAEKLAQAVLDNRAAPFYIRSDAASWLRDIRQWKKEGEPQPSSRFEKAVALMRGLPPGSTPPSRSGLVLNLRASGLLHEALEDTNSARYPEALLYAGIVSQSLGDLNLGFLDQYYFESCIRQVPHTELAEECYERLEQSVQSANPFLDMEPETEWARLNELRKMSEVQDAVNPAWRRRSWEFDLNEPPRGSKQKRGQGK